MVTTQLFTTEQVQDALFARSVDNAILNRFGLSGERRDVTDDQREAALWDIVNLDMPVDYEEPYWDANNNDMTQRKPADWDQRRLTYHEQLRERYITGNRVLERGKFVTTERYTSNAHGDALCDAAGPVDSPWVQVTAGFVATTQAYRCVALKAK